MIYRPRDPDARAPTRERLRTIVAWTVGLAMTAAAISHLALRAAQSPTPAPLPMARRDQGQPVATNQVPALPPLSPPVSATVLFRPTLATPSGPSLPELPSWPTPGSQPYLPPFVPPIATDYPTEPYAEPGPEYPGLELEDFFKPRLTPALTQDSAP
jgi:hypothetical protein